MKSVGLVWMLATYLQCNLPPRSPPQLLSLMMNHLHACLLLLCSGSLSAVCPRLPSGVCPLRGVHICESYLQLCKIANLLFVKCAVNVCERNRKGVDVRDERGGERYCTLDPTVLLPRSLFIRLPRSWDGVHWQHHQQCHQLQQYRWQKHQQSLANDSISEVSTSPSVCQEWQISDCFPLRQPCRASVHHWIQEMIPYPALITVSHTEIWFLLQ